VQATTIKNVISTNVKVNMCYLSAGITTMIF